MNGSPVVLYLVNQYPKLSHSFIRREIRAVEAAGICVRRASIRRPPEDLLNAAEQEEALRTRTVLDLGVGGLAAALVRVVLARPLAFGRALAAAIGLGWRSERGLPRHLAYLAEACVLLGWCREWGVQHVHAHFGTNATAAALLLQRLGGPPFSFTVHGPEEFDRPEAIGLSRKLRAADFSVAVSHFGRSQLSRWCPAVDAERIHVVRCGVDAAFLEAEPTPLPGTPRLICVGRLCPEKRQLDLVDAAARLAERSSPFELVFVGDGPCRTALEQRISRRGLGGQVRLLGARPEKDVVQEMRAARVLVLPSCAEGLPVVLMEALALGRPVITTHVAGIPELVIDGVCGWLVPSGDTDALVEALERALATSPDDLASMGQAGAARVRELHDASRQGRRLAELFRTSVASSVRVATPRS